MDIATDFADLGLSADVIEVLSKHGSALESIIEASKKPLITKRDELLSQISSHKTFIDGLGGADKIKSLAQQASEAEQKIKDAQAASTDVNAVREALGKEVSSRDEKINKLLSEKKDAKVRSTVKRALTEAKGDADLLMPHITSRIKSELNDAGDVVITVLDEKGGPMLVGSEAKPASVKDLLETMKKNTSFAKAFAASGISGSGANGAPNITGVTNPWLPQTFNLTKQGQVARENPELASALKAAAGKS
jgi:hypothetical protein